MRAKNDEDTRIGIRIVANSVEDLGKCQEKIWRNVLAREAHSFILVEYDLPYGHSIPSQFVCKTSFIFFWISPNSAALIWSTPAMAWLLKRTLRVAFRMAKTREYRLAHAAGDRPV